MKIAMARSPSTSGRYFNEPSHSDLVPATLRGDRLGMLGEALGVTGLQVARRSRPARGSLLAISYQLIPAGPVSQSEASQPTMRYLVTGAIAIWSFNLGDRGAPRVRDLITQSALLHHDALMLQCIGCERRSISQRISTIWLDSWHMTRDGH